MRWICVTMMPFVLAAACLAGYRLGRKGGKWPIIGLAASLPLLLLRAMLSLYPNVAIALIPFDWYSGAHRWWGLAVGFFMLGLATAALRRCPTRRLAQVCEALLVLTAAAFLMGAVRCNPSKLNGRPSGPNGACYQTASFSCGPAAAATLLSQWGVATTEQEMARLCHTNGVMGTDALPAYWAVNRKLPRELEASLVRADADDLPWIGVPAMALIRSTPMRNHWVVILQSDREQVRLADPAGSVYEVSRDHFARDWSGILILIDELPPSDLAQVARRDSQS